MKFFFFFAGGIGGLAAASAALRHFDKVTLVDQDDLRTQISSETMAEVSFGCTVLNESDMKLPSSG